MEEVLTESFCERCGTRYEFEAPTRLNTLRKTRGLVSGLKNYILSQDALGDAIGDAMRSEEESLASNQLAAFHEAFNFCINCRQYACTNCWNDAAGRCRTCAPIPGVDDLDERMEAAYLADHSAMHGGAVLDREMAPDEISRRLSVDAWPQTDLTEAPATNGHAAVEWPTEPGLVQFESPAEPQPAAAEAEVEVEPVRAEEPVLAEEPVPEPIAPEVSPILGWESDAEEVMAAVFAEPEPEPAVAAIVAEPEPEPAVAAEPQPEPAVAAEFSQPELATAQISDEPAPEAEWLVDETAAELEPEPEPIYAEAEPEPVAADETRSEPVLAEVADVEPVAAEIEPEHEPAAAKAAAQEIETAEPVAELPPPTPIAPRRIVPISETVIPAPETPLVSQPPQAPPAPRPLHPQPVAAEAPPIDAAALAARKAQLELLGIDDPGVGTVAPVRPDRLAYRSRGAATHPSELVHRTLGSSPLWDASAREVAAARSVVAVQNCGGCGLSLSASARFCRRCGTRQAQPA